MAVEQVSLWEQAQEETKPAIGDIFEATVGWADGDTSPERLERLALTVLGDVGGLGEKKPYVWYRIIGTGIVEHTVVAACQIIENPLGVSWIVEEEEEEDE